MANPDKGSYVGPRDGQPSGVANENGSSREQRRRAWEKRTQGQVRDNARQGARA